MEAQIQMSSSTVQTLSCQVVRSITQFHLDNITKIATWNIKTWFAAGKLDNLMYKRLIQPLGRSINTNIIQINAPSADKPEKEFKDFYKQLDQVLKLTKTN